MFARRISARAFGGILLALGAALFAGLPVFALSSPVLSGPPMQATSAPTPVPTSQPKPVVNESIGNDTCLSCHSNPNLSMKLENGELLGLYVPPDVYNHSLHGEKGYACVQCHTTVGEYPHPVFTAADARDASLKLYEACKRCHSSQFELTQDSVHSMALAAGKREAAICTDCHTAHAVRQLTDPQTSQLLAEARVWVPQTCAKCHYAIYQKYTTSVHGSALLGEGNPDVPTCIDCHGVHNIENPTTAAFRLKSPDLCAKCHTDPTIMDKYGISTQVLNTYVSDFHGTTVTLFRKEHPDQQTNKPVCFDCHGVHDIQRVDDPVAGLQIRENLLARCQVCHPQASLNFPSAWLSHYIPSPERNPLVFTINTFYKFFIPGVLGGMALLVVLDVSSLLRKWIRGRRPAYPSKGAKVYPLPEPEKGTSASAKPAGSSQGSISSHDNPGTTTPGDQSSLSKEPEEDQADKPPLEPGQASPQEETPNG